jgi:hypothetical protein
MTRKVNSQDIVQERLNDPYMRMADIGRKYSISRERVRQILSENNQETFVKKPTPYCSGCGRPYSRKANFPHKWKLCRKCMMKLPKQTRDIIRNPR